MFAQELLNELERRPALVRQLTAEPSAAGGRTDASQPVRIDVPDILHQLSSADSRQRLVHFFTWNHRWVAQLAERNRRAASTTYDFLDAHAPGALFTANQMDVIRSKRDLMMELDGHILDLGVYKGGSTRALARIFEDRHIHGFDSFEGLPEDWSHVLKGDFGEIAGTLPDMPANVTLYRGWFDETLPVWLAHHEDEPISILRVDCDIYSSTKTIFDVLEPSIRPGTWIVFDELIGYRGWQDHEHKAFMEFIDRTGYRFEYVAHGLTYAMVRLTDAEPG